MKLADCRKASAALSAGVAVAVAGGLVTGSWAAGLTTGVAAVGAALATYATTDVRLVAARKTIDGLAVTVALAGQSGEGGADV